MCARRLERDLQAAGNRANRRLAEEVEAVEVGLARSVDLRVRTGIVGPEAEVLAGERERQAAYAQAVRPVLRRRERDGDFTQPDEVRVLHVAVYRGSHTRLA